MTIANVINLVIFIFAIMNIINFKYGENMLFEVYKSYSKASKSQTEAINSKDYSIALFSRWALFSHEVHKFSKNLLNVKDKAIESKEKEIYLLNQMMQDTYKKEKKN